MTTRILAALLASAAALTACGSNPSADGNQAEANLAANDVAAVAEQDGIDPVAGDEGEATNNSSENEQAGDGDRTAAAIPARFHGEWNSDISACGKPSLTRLIVSADRLAFYESSGSVRAVDREGERVISVASTYQGEGETWQATRRLSLSPDGDSLTVSGSGATLTRQRCP